MTTPQGQTEPYQTPTPPYPMTVFLEGPTGADVPLQFARLVPNAEGGLDRDTASADRRARHLVRGGKVILPVPPTGTWGSTDWNIVLNADVAHEGASPPDLELTLDGGVIATINNPTVISAETVRYTYDANHDFTAGGALGLRFAVGTSQRAIGGQLSLDAIADPLAGDYWILTENLLPHGGYAFSADAVPGAALPITSTRAGAGILTFDTGQNGVIIEAGDYRLWMNEAVIRSDRTGAGAMLPIDIELDGSPAHTHTAVRAVDNTTLFTPFRFFVDLTLAAGLVTVVNGDATFDVTLAGALAIRQL